jgi:RNA polymerase sigma-70 factor (ECF subfamily)
MRFMPVLDEALAAGQVAWPEVRIDREALRRTVDKALAGDQAPGSLRLADLYLACASLSGDPAALRALDTMIRAAAARAAGELGQPGWLADEIALTLRERLLVSDGEAEGRLSSYLGHGPLDRWLAVAAARTGLNALRARRREQPLDDSRLAALPSPEDDPELDLLRRRHRAAFETAIRDAFAGLESARDRNLLRLYYFDRVGLDRLAQMYNVHGSTVSRWLAAVRQTVFDQTVRLLVERLGLPDSELASMLRLLQSDLEVTLSRLLAPTT